MRTSLKKGDLVFFLPKKSSWVKAVLDDYICAGILVVDRVLVDKKEILAEPALTATYKRSWEQDLKIHLIRDRREAPRTASVRGKNFIIGDIEKSHWFGRNEYYLKDIMKDIGLSSHVKITNRRIKKIEGKEGLMLYNALSSRINARARASEITSDQTL